MKKSNKSTLLKRRPHAGYGAQDFEQGRGGMQSGKEGEEKIFSQFHNAGNGGYAAQSTANSSAVVKTKKIK